MIPGRGGEPRAAPGEGLALVAFTVFTALAVIGFASFGRHPSLLAGLPPAVAAFHARSFSFFAQGQVWLAGAVLAVPLVRRVGWRALPAFAALYLLSLAAELGGTGWGVPFGAYAYTAALGPAWLDRVPVVIPLSWFCMALPSFALAARTGVGPGARVGLATLGLVAWDLALDPAMSHVTYYWRWAEAGPYYGMPLLNLAGWGLTGLVLMLTLEALGAARWTARLPTRWLAGYWLVNLALPLGLCMAAGAWGAVVLTVAVAAALGVTLMRLSTPRGAGAAVPAPSGSL